MSLINKNHFEYKFKNKGERGFMTTLYIIFAVKINVLSHASTKYTNSK